MEKVKFQYRNREFCCRGYYVDTAKNERKIAAYIKNQLKEDVENNQLILDLASFTGNK